MHPDSFSTTNNARDNSWHFFSLFETSSFIFKGAVCIDAWRVWISQPQLFQWVQTSRGANERKKFACILFVSFRKYFGGLSERARTYNFNRCRFTGFSVLIWNFSHPLSSVHLYCFAIFNSLILICIRRPKI